MKMISAGDDTAGNDTAADDGKSPKDISGNTPTAAEAVFLFLQCLQPITIRVSPRPRGVEYNYVMAPPGITPKTRNWELLAPMTRGP